MGHTVESLEFGVAQSYWYSRVALPHEYTSLTKTNFGKDSYLIETENGYIHKITSPRISEKTTIHESWPQ